MYFSSGVKKTKAIAILIASFVVFATTLFTLAENKNANTLFLDSDQDGLTDQEEKMIGTDSTNPDTDGDGYSDGKEVGSGYNPLKPAPGDKIVASSQTSEEKTEQSNNKTTEEPLSGSGDLLDQMAQNNLVGNDIFSDVSSDPSNPNLTNEMIGQLMQLAENKISTSDSFAENPSFSSDELNQVTQNALQSVDIAKELPEIADSELNILPPVDNSPRSSSGGAVKKLAEDEVKTEEKKQIEKYLAQMAFVLASNSPFTVEKTSDLEANLNTESTNLITAIATGNTEKVATYAEKAQTGIDQLKKIEVPYVLKEMHKSVLQLAIFTLGLKDDIALNTDDPMKSLAAVSSLQAVAENTTKLQEEFSQILEKYGIEFINFP